MNCFSRKTTIGLSSGFYRQVLHFQAEVIQSKMENPVAFIINSSPVGSIPCGAWRFFSLLLNLTTFAFKSGERRCFVFPFSEYCFGIITCNPSVLSSTPLHDVRKVYVGVIYSGHGVRHLLADISLVCAWKGRPWDRSSLSLSFPGKHPFCSA